MEDYSKVKGIIFNIQKFSIHDGPGIRTIIFLRAVSFGVVGVVTLNHKFFNLRK